MSRVGSLIPPEYTWYGESSQRRGDGPDSANPTNDITIPLHMPRQSMPVQQFSMVSLEIPLTQYTVENLWSRLYFSEGLKLLGDSVTGDAVRSFAVQINGVQYTAQLPLFLNPIVDVDVSTPTSPVFTTQFPHSLDMRGSWTWEPMQLISTPLTQADNPDFVNLTAENPYLTVIDEYSFTLTGTPSLAGITATTSYGYLYAPAIPNPELLAEITTAALNLVLPGAFTVSYNTSTGQFRFQSERRITTCETIGPLNTTDSIFILIPSRNTLPALMGFGVGDINVPATEITYHVTNEKYFGAASELVPKECAPPGTCREVALNAGFGYQCMSQAVLQEGNYDNANFGGEVNFQLNRFYFDPGETALLANEATFVFSNEIGDFYTVQVPYGQYTPESFAAFLQDAMNAADPLNDTYSVTYGEGTNGVGQFCFTSDHGFGLEFGNGTDTVHPRLGFQSICYRGQTTYCSQYDVNVPLVQCCGSSISTRRPGSLHMMTISSSTNKVCFHSCSRPCISGGEGTLIDGGDVLQVVFPDTLTYRAHGFQPNDVVSIRTDTGDVYQLTVLSVPNYYTVNLDPGSTGITEQDAATLCAYEEPYFNLYFNTSLYTNASQLRSVYARFFGFSVEDQLDVPGTGILCAPYVMNISTPDHVLVVVNDPKGSTHNSHYASSGNIPDVLAKVLLYPQFRYQSVLSYTMYLPSVQAIGQMRLVVLTPDHQPYQFHGRDWSFSMSMLIAENVSAQLIAY